MFLMKKAKGNISFTIVDKVVTTYFKYLYENKIALSYKDISELFRVSICNILVLDTDSNSNTINMYLEDVILLLSPLFDNKIALQTEEYKQGVLEACVHCMEMSRRRVCFNG